MQKKTSLQKFRATYESNETVFVIYEGSKTFWRQRLTADIYVIKHSTLQTLEIVYFLPNSSIEVPRVYIALSALLNHFDEREIKEKFNLRKEVLIRQRKPIDNNSILEKVTEDLAIAFLVSKIDLQASSSGNGYQISIEANDYNGDNSNARTKGRFICAKPNNLKPLVIHHSALSSTEDFKSTLQKFREDSKAAKSHSEEAIHALHPGADGFQQVLSLKLQHDREIKLTYSRAKCRWIHAINRVVIQNYVAKVRQRLADMDAQRTQKPVCRKSTTKLEHRTLDNSVLEHRHSDSLPPIVIDSNLSQRAQIRIKRQVSRSDSSRNLLSRNTFDSNASPAHFPTPLSSLSLNCIEIPAASAVETEVTAAVDLVEEQDLTPPSILHSFRDKSMEQYSSMNSLSIPWLNDSDDDRSIKSTKRTVLRPIAKRRSGKILIP